MSTISPAPTTLTLRLATPADDPGVARLAQLDSAERPAGPLLVAFVDDAPLAALALESGAVIADPFQRTADVVALLRGRAATLEGDGSGRARRVTLAARLRSARLRPVA